MGKYMKYEIKGSYKFILGIIAILIIASTIIQGNLKSVLNLDDPSSMAMGMGMTGFKGLMLGVSVLVIFGAFLVAFFHIIGSFRKELYEDRGYLTFTLPLSGNQIVGSKLIVAMLWFTAIGIATLIYNIILGLILFGGSWVEMAREVFSMINTGVLSFGLVSIVGSILTLLLIYFSIALSRVSIRNKKIGGIWFIVFIILNALTGYITLKISSAIPYFLSLDGFNILHYYELSILPGFNNGIGDILILGSNYAAYINIVGFLSYIVFSVATFMGTGYLIEKKIDL